MNRNTSLTALTFVVLSTIALGSVSSAEPKYDLLLRNGEVIDGTGRERFRSDVAIRDGLIVQIGELNEATAHTVIDVEGKLVAPGFIDLHSHAEGGLVSKNKVRRSAPNLITQGITTVAVNQDGGGAVDLANQRRTMQRLGVGLNVIPLVGHGNIRRAVMKGDDDLPDYERPASPEETREMQAMLQRALEDGAFGMSAGLEYVPGRWSTPRELEMLAETLAKHNGVFVVHERSSGSRPMWYLPSRDPAGQPSMLDNLRELILIADSTKVTMVATHIKARGTDFWGSSKAMNELIQQARENGLSFYADQYPYNTSGSDGRIVLIPSWAAVPTPDEKQLKEDATERKIDYATRLEHVLAQEKLAVDLRRDVAYEITRRGGADSILIVEHPDEKIVGKSLAEFASASECNAVEAAFRLQLLGDHSRRGGGRLRAFSMSEKDVEAFAKTSWTATSSDAGIALPEDGPVHPRFYGAFPRKIRHYAIDRGLMSIEEAVRVSTSLPASILHLKNRGVLRENAVADLVVFDPERIRDKADAFQPHQYSEGIDLVIVNGKVAVKKDKCLQVLAGKVLRPNP